MCLESESGLSLGVGPLTVSPSLGFGFQVAVVGVGMIARVPKPKLE